MYIEDFRIVEVYPFIVKGVNDSGEIKCFPISYALLNQERRDAQEEYWAEVESEFGHQDADVRWNIRRRR